MIGLYIPRIPTQGRYKIGSTKVDRVNALLLDHAVRELSEAFSLTLQGDSSQSTYLRSPRCRTEQPAEVCNVSTQRRVPQKLSTLGAQRLRKSGGAQLCALSAYLIYIERKHWEPPSPLPSAINLNVWRSKRTPVYSQVTKPSLVLFIPHDDRSL